MVCITGQWIAAGMVMGDDEGAGIFRESLFEDLPWVNSRLRNGASKKLLTFNEVQSGVQVEAKKDLMGKAANFGLQELPDMVG